MKPESSTRPATVGGYPGGASSTPLVDAAITTAPNPELIKQDWEAAGLKISMNVVAGELCSGSGLDPVEEMRIGYGGSLAAGTCSLNYLLSIEIPSKRENY